MRIVHRQIETIHGTIAIQTDIGRGTTVTVVVPDRGRSGTTADSEGRINGDTI